MSELTITPFLAKKTAKCAGVIAGGEQVAVTIENAAGIQTQGLRLRILFDDRTFAKYPLYDTDTWTVSGSSITFTLNLETAPILELFRSRVPAFMFGFVLDNTETGELYFDTRHELKRWSRVVGRDEPVDLHHYRDDMVTILLNLSEHISATETKVDKIPGKGLSTLDVTPSMMAAKANADDVYAKAEADRLLAGCTAAAERALSDHDGSVSAHGDIRAELKGKASAADTYTRTETDNAISAGVNSHQADSSSHSDIRAEVGRKANSADVYTKTETDSAVSGGVSSHDSNPSAHSDMRTEIGKRPTFEYVDGLLKTTVTPTVDKLAELSAKVQGKAGKTEVAVASAEESDGLGELKSKFNGLLEAVKRMVVGLALLLSGAAFPEAPLYTDLNHLKGNAQVVMTNTASFVRSEVAGYAKTYPLFAIDLGGSWTDFILKASTNNFSSLCYLFNSAAPEDWWYYELHKDLARREAGGYDEDARTYALCTESDRRVFRVPVNRSVGAVLYDYYWSYFSDVSVMFCPSHCTGLGDTDWMREDNASLRWIYVRVDAFGEPERNNYGQWIWRCVEPRWVKGPVSFE